MDNLLFNQTKQAAYCLWEHIGFVSALNCWYCAEDMAVFFAASGLTEPASVEAIRQINKEDPAYIRFVRHMAFRIYVYANRDDALANWFAAEHLLADGEWQRALTAMAAHMQAKPHHGITDILG